MRINRYFSDSGICSRRTADKLIESGRVRVNGNIALPGMMVNKDDKVFLDGRRICPRGHEEYDYLAFYKPKGVICTANEKIENNIIDFIGYHKRLFTVGRLDRDSEGLILLTDDGKMSAKLLNCAHGHEKEYLVKTAEKIDAAFLRRMCRGVRILGTVTAPCRAKMIDSHTFVLVLTQGLNRQIRRMCEKLGRRVVFLKRTAFMHITLKDLEPGTYRKLSEKETKELKRRSELAEAHASKKPGHRAPVEKPRRNRGKNSYSPNGGNSTLYNKAHNKKR